MPTYVDVSTFLPTYLPIHPFYIDLCELLCFRVLTWKLYRAKPYPWHAIPYYLPTIPPVWPDGYIICLKFGHLEQWKFALQCKILAKVRSQFCQILNSYLRNGSRLFKFGLSGKMLPNLVTLHTTYLSTHPPTYVSSQTIKPKILTWKSLVVFSVSLPVICAQTNDHERTDVIAWTVH